MDKRLIGNAIEFLSRVQLVGGEVPAYNEVMAALHNLRASTAAEGAPEAHQGNKVRTPKKATSGGGNGDR